LEIINQAALALVRCRVQAMKPTMLGLYPVPVFRKHKTQDAI